MAKLEDDLRKFFDSQKITQKDIANKLGVSTAYINSLFKGKRAFGKEQAEIWANHFGLSPAWLLTGEGSMLKETSNEDNNASFVAPYIKDELIYLPLFSVPALASFMENTLQATGTIETYPVYVAKGEAYTKDKHIVIEVKGESMYPTINNKAMILCEKVEPEQWANIPNEKVVAVVYSNSFTIKRLLKNNLAINNSLTLLADNRKYGETTLQRYEIRAIFRVIKKVSEEVF